MDKKLFKQMFVEYCMDESSKGWCEDGDCEFCVVNKAYKRIFNDTSYLIAAIDEALEQYDNDNIDIVVDDEFGCIDLMYHSDNNSFCIKRNVCSLDECGEDDIEYFANLYNVGYAL